VLGVETSTWLRSWQPHPHPRGVSLATWNTFAQICEKWLVHKRVIVAQLQVAVSDSRQVDQDRRIGQSPVGIYTEVPECGLSRGARADTKFFMVNGISILSLWNIQLTFEQEEFRHSERHH